MSELSLIMRLVHLPLELVKDKDDYLIFAKAHGRLLGRTDPSKLDVAVGIALLRSTYVGRELIGQPWNDFLDRLRAAIEKNHKDKNADECLRGL